MSLEGSQALDGKEIPAPLVLETSRVLVLKRGTDKKFKALFCENSNSKALKGRDADKTSKYEIPGGKIFDNEQEKAKKFNNLPETAKEELRTQTAADELEQETGVYINPCRLVKISSEFSELLGEPHPNFPNATHRKTNIYVVILGADEYLELPELTAASLDNDDRHASIDWHEEFEVEDLCNSELEGLIARNSTISPEAAQKINGIAENITLRVGEQVSTLANQQNTSISQQGLNSLEYSQARKPGTDKISSIDFNGQPPLSKEAFYESFKVQFGLELNAQSLEGFVKRVLLQYCKPYLLERSVFLGEYSNNLAARAYARRLGTHIDIITQTIKKPDDFYLFYKRANNSPIGRRLLRSFFGYGKISQLDYFSHIEGNEKDFNEKLASSITEKDPRTNRAKKDDNGRYEIKLPTHGRKCFLELDSGVKTLSRMASKSTTKVDVDPYDIKDVYRARIVVEDESDIDEIVTLLMKRLGRKNAQKIGAWELEKDRDPDTNINRDKKRKETKVKGRYPIKGTKGIPIEFMIMTKASYARNESGANHHDVYLAIQTLVEDSRPTDGIPSSSMETVIQRLAKEAAVLKSYPNYTEASKNWQSEQAQRDIRERFNDYFFEHNGFFYAYQHVHRVRNASILARQEDEIFLGMTIDLNQKIGCILTAQEWKQLFDAPGTFPPDKLLKKVGFSLPEFFEILGRLKWDTDLDLDKLRIKVVEGLKALTGNKDIYSDVFWSLNKGYENFGDRDRKRLKNNKEALKNFVKDIHGNSGFLNFLGTL